MLAPIFERGTTGSGCADDGERITLHANEHFILHQLNGINLMSSVSISRWRRRLVSSVSS